MFVLIAEFKDIHTPQLGNTGAKHIYISLWCILHLSHLWHCSADIQHELEQV